MALRAALCVGGPVQELHSRKTEELYLSVQRAKQEAAKDKQEQRIRMLARKGHDVSKLLHCMEEESPTQVYTGG